MELTEEEIKKLQADLVAAQEAAEHQKNINKEVIASRDEAKKKASEVENKLKDVEGTVLKTASELAAEVEKRTQVAALHTAMLKTTAVRAQLEKEGVTAMDTALKLIAMDQITVDDAYIVNTDMVASVVTKLKETDAVLFGTKPAVDTTTIPKPKRASEGEPKAGFAEELKNCKNAGEVEALLRKHGKIS